MDRGSIATRVLMLDIQPIVRLMHGNPSQVHLLFTSIIHIYYSHIHYSNIAHHDSDQMWIRQIARHKLEQDEQELETLLCRTRACHEKTRALGQERSQSQPLLDRAERTLEDIHKTIHVLRSNIQSELAKPCRTKAEAVTCIQNMWKIRQSKKRLRELIHQLYRRVLDPNSGQYYYVNTQTNATSWTKPAALGSEEDVAVFEVVKAKKQEKQQRRSWTRESGAQAIQSMVRTHNARRAIQKMLREIIEVHTDEATGNVFYYNRQTRETSWTAPSMYRRPPEASLSGSRNQQRRIINRDKLERIQQSPDVAVTVIQGMFRHHQARAFMRKLVYEAYEKVWDEASGRHYYFHRHTGQSQWDKPTFLLEHEDLPEVRDDD